ncbi:Vinorine synthase [Bertholletia excelsa]
MKLEIALRETIKPSSPTPPELRIYRLSFLDQISPLVYMPIILFFGSVDGAVPGEKSCKLKTSLSETLTRFYPLAGRLVENDAIDCNDDGVSYVEAQAKCRVSDVTGDPIPGEFNKLLPQELDVPDDKLLSVQVTFFSCGGVAIATCISHKVADALSIVLFITTWAAVARGVDPISPLFETAKLFPPKDRINSNIPSAGITKEPISTKRFVFKNAAVAALREKYTDRMDEDNPIRPTRVEALSVFIWNRFAEATQVESSPDKLHVVIHAVNLRPRFDPPLPENSFGNLYRIALAIPFMETGEESRGLVRQMRETIKSIDSDYVKELQEGDDHLNFLTEQAQNLIQGQLTSFSFTSLCRLPLYEADFGWGKPGLVGSTRLPFKNLVTFMDTRAGDGIEAWINLEEEEMTMFEADKELLAYTSPTF